MQIMSEATVFPSPLESHNLRASKLVRTMALSGRFIASPNSSPSCPLLPIDDKKTQSNFPRYIKVSRFALVRRNS